MRFSVVTFLLVTLLLASACSDSQSVAGRWDCATSHPGGFVSSDIFDFSDTGTMTLDSDGMLMHGSYTQEGTRLTMQLRDVPIPNPSGQLATQAQTLTATIEKKSAKELAMDVSTGNDHHLSTCRRN